MRLSSPFHCIFIVVRSRVILFLRICTQTSASVAVAADELATRQSMIPRFSISFGCRHGKRPICRQRRQPEEYRKELFAVRCIPAVSGFHLCQMSLHCISVAIRTGTQMSFHTAIAGYRYQMNYRLNYLKKLKMMFEIAEISSLKLLPSLLHKEIQR